MGTVIEFEGVKIKINAKDHNPPHAHIEGNGGKARYNLKTMEFIEYSGFSRSDLNTIESIIRRKIWLLLDEWRRFHE